MTSTAKSLLSLLIILIASAGCTTHQGEVKKFAGLGPTVSDIGQLSFTPLVPGEETASLMDDSAPVILLATGKTRIRGYRLPDGGGRWTVKIKSFLEGETPEKGYVFFPRAVFLDVSFAERNATSLQDFTFQKGAPMEASKASMTAWGFKLEGKLEASGSDARYLVVYTTDEIMKGSGAIDRQNFFPLFLPGIPPMLIPTGSTTSTKIPFGPSGSLTLTLMKGQ